MHSGAGRHKHSAYRGGGMADGLLVSIPVTLKPTSREHFNGMNRQFCLLSSRHDHTSGEGLGSVAL